MSDRERIRVAENALQDARSALAGLHLKGADSLKGPAQARHRRAVREARQAMKLAELNLTRAKREARLGELVVVSACCGARVKDIDGDLCCVKCYEPAEPVRRRGGSDDS